MDRTEIKSRIKSLNVWRRGDQRAPHKPLLLLYAMGRCLRGGERLIPYADVDRDVKKLLKEFGPARRSYHPEYPFWRLQSDGIWELENKEAAEPRAANTDLRKTELLKHNVRGGLRPEVYRQLTRDKKLFAEIVTQLLDASFPASIHEDILQAVGLDIDYLSAITMVRDPRFRDRILTAYEYQCAVCGFNVRVGESLVGLEAAHIKWHQAGGPDSEENGIALCALHHKLFDRGAFTITEDMAMHVSEAAHGTSGFNEWLMAYHGKEIRPPQRQSYCPEPQFIDWHVKEVFKGYARQI